MAGSQCQMRDNTFPEHTESQTQASKALIMLKRSTLGRPFTDVARATSTHQGMFVAVFSVRCVQTKHSVKKQKSTSARQNAKAQTSMLWRNRISNIHGFTLYNQERSEAL